MNAGHCPPILRHGDGSIESLAPTRPVLGLALDEHVSLGAAAVGSGDRLLLYTDGVTEAANDAGEEFGEERLSGILERR